MIVLRLFIYLALIAIGISVITFFITKNAAYLRFAWQILKFSAILLLVLAALIAMGRIILF